MTDRQIYRRMDGQTDGQNFYINTACQHGCANARSKPLQFL